VGGGAADVALAAPDEHPPLRHEKRCWEVAVETGATRAPEESEDDVEAMPGDEGYADRGPD